MGEKTGIWGQIAKEILNHKYFLTLFASLGILSFLIIHDSILFKTVAELKQPMIIPICKLLIVFCTIFFIILFICWIYEKIEKTILSYMKDKKDVSDIKFELLNSNPYIKVGLARMFYSKGHSYESTMEESLWMFDAEQRKLIAITIKPFIFGENKVEKCFSHFNPKVLKILQDHNFEESYFEDYQHIRLDREQLDKNIKNAAEISFKARKQVIEDREKSITKEGE